MGRSKEQGVDDKGASDTEIDAKILFDEYILKNARVYSAGEGKADRCRAPIDSKKPVPLKNSANTDSLKITMVEMIGIEPTTS